METQHREKVVVVFNPAKVDEDELRELVTAQAPASARVEWVETTPEDSGYAQATAAAQSGASLVLAAGGDGTVRLVASALTGTGVALGVIPAGTGNLLARNLDLPLSLSDSVRRALHGRDSTIDVCEARLHWADRSNDVMRFVVMAGVGADAQMIEHTDENLKRRVGPLAYIPGVLRALGGGNNVTVTFTFDGQRVAKKRLHTLIIGNCGDVYSNVPLLPHAVPDDGKLDLVAIAPRGIFGWLRIGGDIVVNTLVRLWNRDPRNVDNQMRVPRPPNALTYDKGERVTIEFDSPEVFEVDGDPVGRVRAAEIEIKPGALVVRV
ncbi:diacylglycerol/lipid kinase family protein [Corynebacterium qintianiae]|uniref:diacylglycerol/lipid kinase family protein n=1 Tax=Corynebacterium qintianiae TaxID=2709392 RepID=UPI0013EB2274|nr:diacylglycerol kinase family protein [Corynebacterium qintianiae]